MPQKRVFYVILTLFLAVLLVFTGCPTDADTDTTTEYQQGTGSKGKGLPVYQKTLDASASAADVTRELNDLPIGGTLILSSSTGSTSMPVDDLTVAYGRTLQIGNDVSLEVPASGTATITGEVSVTDGGTFDVQTGGEVTIAGTVSVTDGGEFDVQDGGEVTIAGELKVENGGTVDLSTLPVSGNDDAITITGTITVESGGIFHAPPDQVGPSGLNPAPQIAYAGGGKVVLKEGSLGYIGTALLIAPDSTGSPHFEWEAGTGGLLEFGLDLITLTSGKVKTSQNGAGVRKAVIGPGAELDVGHIFGVQYLLTINGTLTGSGTIAGLNLNVSTITFGPNATISSIPANFYQSDTTTVETNAADMQGKTYVWSSGNKWIANP
jgi:hypothetical protein